MEHYRADIDPIRFWVSEIRADPALLEKILSEGVISLDGLFFVGFLEAANQIREDNHLPRMKLGAFCDL